MRKLLPSKLKQNVGMGEMYEFTMMWLEQLRAGVFLIIITINKYDVDAADLRRHQAPVRRGRILAKMSRIPSLKEACQQVAKV